MVTHNVILDYKQLTVYTMLCKTIRVVAVQVQ